MSTLTYRSLQNQIKGVMAMKDFWNFLQLLIAVIGGWIGYFIGGCDGFIITLLIFVIFDYITGVLCAISDKQLSSKVGFKGITKKILIFVLVGLANILDLNILKTGSVLRTATIFFYLSNEGISILENMGHLGIKYPDKIKDVLEQLHDKEK